MSSPRFGSRNSSDEPKASDDGPWAKRPYALKHGVYSDVLILPGEDPQVFMKLYNGLVKEWDPQGPTEADAVSDLAKLMWRKSRVQLLFEYRTSGKPLGAITFLLDDGLFERELALDERLSVNIGRVTKHIIQLKAMKQILDATRKEAPVDRSTKVARIPLRP